MIFLLEVKKKYCNRYNKLHGGCSATIIDIASTLNIAKLHQKGHYGVSCDLNVSFLSTASLGEKIKVDVQPLKIGGTLAFAEVTLSNSQGDIIATGRHTKFVAKS
eukprot:TRINITY_DN3743_c0_g1_i1.p1 TRINITY_DN3743_c0_g1~~TRINITY_DN3743_c0_g1_i1.p1  ORF type:complete len:105 (+),score=22.98 TRINITY_DN3743_c0_g1_i1:205-519(+)